MKSTVNLGLIGYGYWGPNLLRNFFEVDGATIAYCADISKAALSKVNRRYPGVKTTTGYRTILADKTVDAVIIATPVATHFSLAKEALQTGKDVLVEKPMTTSFEEAQSLVDLASKNGRILMVDHTFIYTPAVQRIKQLITKGILGKLLYVDSVRIALGLFQSYSNVVFDLACHDFAIIDYLFGKEPAEISATGMAHFGSKQESLAYVHARYKGKFLAHTHVSWLSPVKVRTMTFSGSKNMIVYNDLEPSDKVRVFDKGVVVEKSPEKIFQARFGYRSGDIRIPNLEVKEALANLAEHFVSCVINRTQPISDGQSGARVIKILEAATKSLRSGGKVIKLAPRN